jgi:hypothetical protein
VRVQARPFQDSVKTPAADSLSKPPTAWQLRGPAQDTPSRMLSKPGRGLGVTDQARPFQVSTRARSPGSGPPW